jgi:hypothetical protein
MRGHACTQAIRRSAIGVAQHGGQFRKAPLQAVKSIAHASEVCTDTLELLRLCRTSNTSD